MEVKTHDRELMQKSAQRLCSEQHPVEKFKLGILRANGCRAIKSVRRKFKNMDDSGDGKISYEEFAKGCTESRLNLTEKEMMEIFIIFDRDGNRTLDYDEFLRAVRPPMNESRIRLVNEAFAKMDKTGDGIITISDLINVYDYREHSQYKNGQKTAKQVYMEFLDNFDVEDKGVGEPVITRSEWMDYFSGISASIEDDAYFSLMMRKCWGLK